MTTKRKAYVRPVPSTWWKNLPFYRFYMLREGTAVPAVWFARDLWAVERDIQALAAEQEALQSQTASPVRARQQALAALGSIRKG